MKEKRIKILVMRVGKDSVVEEVENKLEALQGVVGGNIETSSFIYGDKMFVVVCDEEGILKNKPINRSFMGQPFVGDIFIAGVGGEDFISVEETDIDCLNGLIN